MALLGGGTIARSVAEAAARGRFGGLRIIGVAGASTAPSKRVQDVAAMLRVPAVGPDEVLGMQPDWVLEAASVSAAREIMIPALDRGVKLVVMSIGALADPTLLDEITRRRALGHSVVTPPGAIGGLDAISAMNALGELEMVELATTKAPAGLHGAPFLKAAGIRLPTDSRRMVFRGSAREAIAGFPSNVNVAVALALAGIGLDRTSVELHSDPETTFTVHHIRARGSAGEVEITLRNRPHPANPRTSWLAALSAIDAVHRVVTEYS